MTNMKLKSILLLILPALMLLLGGCSGDSQLSDSPTPLPMYTPYPTLSPVLTPTPQSSPTPTATVAVPIRRKRLVA